MSSSSVDNGLQNGGNTGTMECLPSDVVIDILSRLPVESVSDCKLVSKRLLYLLCDRWDQFAKMHHQRQLLELGNHADASSTGLLFSFEKDEEDKTIGLRLYYGDKYNNEMNIHENFSYKTLQKTSISYPLSVDGDVIVGSSNGLICLLKYHDGIPDPIHVCNPTTGEYVNLPEYALREEDYATAFGFGYVHSMNQYKVVRIYYPDSSKHKIGEVQVYTIGSGCGWRTIGTTSNQLFKPSPVGICVNGSLHWIYEKTIVAFNLGDEEFRLIQSPLCDDSFRNSFYTLQALRGNLCFCHQRIQENLLDIWTLKQNATEASWSKEFSITYDSDWEMDGEFPARPLLITKKDEILFVHQGSSLFCYEPKSTMAIKLWDVEKWELMGITAYPYMNSFVSLKALGERSASKKNVREKP